MYSNLHRYYVHQIRFGSSTSLSAWSIVFDWRCLKQESFSCHCYSVLLCTCVQLSSIKLVAFSLLTSVQFIARGIPSINIFRVERRFSQPHVLLHSKPEVTRAFQLPRDHPIANDNALVDLIPLQVLHDLAEVPLYGLHEGVVVPKVGHHDNHLTLDLHGDLELGVELLLADHQLRYRSMMRWYLNERQLHWSFK